jgi:ABC-type transport system involved in multi-copper enzyme maturation permease subunit
MIATLLDIFGRISGFFWLAGPIFEKELRVSSRRKRNYFLRFAYVVLLTVFVTFAWVMATRLGGSASPVFQISRMPEVGKYIVATVVWFQFIAIQFIAIVMLSTAISGEIYHRTLGLLMTTPISSFQIVAGKLFSRLLQLVLLLAISMPLLAIIRVFGGVPWDYVISSLCVTLTATIFAGSVSLLLSIYNRQAHSVIVRAALICFLLYIVPSIVVQLLQFVYQVRIVPRFVLSYINPLIVMQLATQRMLSPSSAGLAVSWPLHCAIMAAASALLLAFSTLCVRRVGLRQATGQAGIFSSRKERRAAREKRRTTAGSTAASRRIRRVKGPPIVWKEMISLLIRTSHLRSVLSVILAVFVLAAAYGYCAYEDCLANMGVQIGFVLVYFFFGLFRAATSAATSITSEKEAHTWPILLATPLTEKQIAFSKIIGSCLQGWLFWLLLAAHVAVFSLARCIHPAAVLPLISLVVSSALLVSAVGVFFSSCFKRSSTSASVNLILFLWFTLPVCQPLPASPLFAAVMILGVAGGWRETATPFQQTGPGWGGLLGAFLISGLALIVLVAIYLSLAFAAFAVSVANIRRRVL